jgi:hypothetical protein
MPQHELRSNHHLNIYMKQLTFIVLLLVVTMAGLSQQTYIDTIATNACKCFEAGKSSVKSSADFNKLGEDCLSEASTPYLEQYAIEEGIEIDNLTEEMGNKLGRKVGMKLATRCPVFVELVNAFPDEEENSSTGKTSGIVTAVQITDHVYITVKEPSGTLTRLVWVFYFDGADAYKANPAKLKGKKIEAEWLEEEIYQVAKKDFVLMKVLSGLEVK